MQFAYQTLFDWVCASLTFASISDSDMCSNSVHLWQGVSWAARAMLANAFTVPPKPALLGSQSHSPEKSDHEASEWTSLHQVSLNDLIWPQWSQANFQTGLKYCCTVLVSPRWPSYAQPKMLGERCDLTITSGTSSLTSLINILPHHDKLARFKIRFSMTCTQATHTLWSSWWCSSGWGKKTVTCFSYS